MRCLNSTDGFQLGKMGSCNPALFRHNLNGQGLKVRVFSFA